MAATPAEGGMHLQRRFASYSEPEGIEYTVASGLRKPYNVEPMPIRRTMSFCFLPPKLPYRNTIRGTPSTGR